MLFIRELTAKISGTKFNLLKVLQFGL